MTLICDIVIALNICCLFFLEGLITELYSGREDQNFSNCNSYFCQDYSRNNMSSASYY